MCEEIKQLVAQVLSSKKHLFERIVERFQGPVMSLIYRFTGDRARSQDAAQETFIKAFKYLKSYDPSRKFTTWILKIANNCAYDHLKKSRRREFFAPGPGDENHQRQVADTAPGPEENVLAIEEKSILQQALERLPDHFREVMILRFVRELSYNDIADTLEIPLSSVKVNIHRARARLVKIYKEMENEQA